MSRTITIATPENITVTYNVAGIASRFLAAVIDLFFRFLILLLGLLIYKFATAGILGVAIGDFASGVFVIFLNLTFFAYPIFFEVFWGGRTPGKKMLGLRVIRDGGYPINFLSSLLRNLLMFLDFGLFPLATPLILCGMPGLCCIFFSPNYKRLGDWAAGTLVIVEPGVSPFQFKRKLKKGNPFYSKTRMQTWNPSQGAQPVLTTLSPQVTALLPLVKNLDRVETHEYQAMRRFKERRNTFELQVQAGLGERIGRPVLEKLEINVAITHQLQFADVIEAIEHRYAEEYGVL